MIEKYKILDKRIMIDILYMLGDALVVCEKYGEALQILEDALSYAIKCNYLRGQANSLRRKSDVLAGMFLFKEALTNCKTAEKLYLQMEERGYAYLLNTKAEIYRLKGDYEEAEKYYKDSLEKSKHINNINRVAHSILGLAETFRLKGINNEPLYKEASKIYEKIGSIWGLVNVNIAMGLASLLEKNNKKFATYLSKAKELIKMSSSEWELSKENKLINKIIKDRNPFEIYPLIFP